MFNRDLRLQAIESELLQLADKFYRLEIQTAVQQMDLVVDLIEEYLQVLQQTRHLQVEEMQSFNEGCALMTDCLKNHDYILVADLIRYELCPSLSGLADGPEE